MREIQWWRKYRYWIGAAGIILLLFWISLPSELFDDPLSTVVYDRNGELLGARIAEDGQWRFPGGDSVPEKYAIALLEFEDQYFYLHPGVNPGSLLRAAIQNIRAGEIRSGGSTITMQVMRMSRQGTPRNIWQKIIEMWLALRYECSTRKAEILQTYADHAPFGGNVVGLEAAAWRYFGTSPHELTWSESALLAVLPNAPALIHPGRNRERLKVKRDNLLEALRNKGKLDTLTCELAINEPLPEAPLPLPDIAPHLTDGAMLDPHMNRLYSTLDRSLQERIIELTDIRQAQLRLNQVHNMACLVMEIETGEVLAYVGNSRGEEEREHGQRVDVIRSQRSTGSILKPFLFAAMLDNGELLSTTLVPDVPVRYNGYAPKNYNRQYEGAVPSYEALSRSLNIPSVVMLRNYGVNAFLELLQRTGFSSFTHSQDHYGLTLILGGGETSLWELAGAYGSMARVLNHYHSTDGNYSKSDFHMPEINLKQRNHAPDLLHEEGILSASSIWITFESLVEVNRPEELSLWYLMSSSRKIAWKTGTSYGFRDAWAVGVTPEYLVAVWAGNADGEGRPGLSGITAAAPLMFDVFSALPPTSWFEAPLDDLEEVEVCRHSGYLAGPLCDDRDTVFSVPRGARSEPCPYHRVVHLDHSGAQRVNGNCYPVHQMKTQNWFILPPLMEWYFKRRHPEYIELPPLMEGCHDPSVAELEIVYPEWDSHLVIPRELDGSKGRVVLEVAHRNPETKVFWHVDQSFIGTTQHQHQLAMDILPGKHNLTVMDEQGNSAKVQFEVMR